jgi:hypothetical protein
MFKINQPGPTQRHTHINLTQFDATRFRHLCILAGCDYLDGFKLMGLKRLLKLMYEVEDINEIIQRLLAKEHKEGYQRHFENANAGFLYQYVYDPRTQLYMRLNPLPPGKLLFDMDVLGESPRITDVPSHRFNQVDDVDLDGLDVLFESLQIDSAASSPSLVLDVSTLTDDEDDEEDDEGEEVYITDKDMIQVEQAVIDEIALRAIATI